MISTQSLVRGASMTLRVVAIAAGGYVLMSAASALAGMGLHAAGVPLSDAMLAAILCGFLLYIAIVMWGFANRRSWLRPLAVIVAAALTMTLASHMAPGALGS